jgi:hypothetical protein
LLGLPGSNVLQSECNMNQKTLQERGNRDHQTHTIDRGQAMDIITEIKQDTVDEVILYLLERGQQPSAHEMLRAVETKAGMEARWVLMGAVERMAKNPKRPQSIRNYLASMLETGSLAHALRGEDAPDQEMISTIDLLLQQSSRYRQSESFQEMIEFMGRFRDYAPYNNMLVRLQNPTCSFYATARDWQHRFGRTLREDARPMLILAPMHPVMLVYDLDQTEGNPLPEELKRFSHFEGEWDPRWLDRLVENAAGYRISVKFQAFSSTLAGFATVGRETGAFKMRVVVHDGLDEPSRCGVLCHELAHILLGHLGSDADHWWPARTRLSRSAVEVEAESVAWIVTSRLGLLGSSEAYVSRHIKDGQTPAGVSPDSIAKAAGLIERMARETLPARRPRARKDGT